MDLINELSKFKRSDVQIIAFIEDVLGLDLSYYDTSSLDASPELRDLAFIGTRNNKEVLVILPVMAEYALLDEDCSSISKCGNIAGEFLRNTKDGNRRVAIQLGYDMLCYTDSSDLENYLYVNINRISGLSFLLDNDISFKLVDIMRGRVAETCLADYILDKDNFLSSTLETNISILKDLSDDIIQASMLAVDKLGYFKSFPTLTSRAVTLSNWGCILRGEKEFDYLTQICMNGCINYTAKFLCRFVFDECKFTLKGFDKMLNLVPKYFSKDKKDFRSPMEAGVLYNNSNSITGTTVYADGNLSKDRAVKKFIEASQILGLNISKVNLVTKYIRGSTVMELTKIIL
jgi:hypothetical protein